MKKIAIFLVCICSMFIFALSASAANNVSSIDIDVVLNKDGSAKIHQIWKGTFIEGTENYYPFMTNNRLEIVDLTVKDENRVYETVSKWNVDSSFAKKAGKCGLNKISGGYEVCWGITEYGEKTYEIDYTVKNVVGAYNESDGFNFRFINSEMNTTPTDATVTVSLWDGTPITDEICNIWGFGYSGNVVFSDGSVKAKTTFDLEYNNHVTLMLEFKKGIFEPSYTENISFEIIKEKAFEGSDYGLAEEDKEFIVLLLICVGIPVLGLIAYLIFNAVKKIKVRSIKKKADYYREAPMDKLNLNYALLSSVGECDESAIIGARMLKLIIHGCIEPVNDGNMDNSFFAKHKVSFRLVSGSDADLDHIDRALYRLLEASAGSDGILEPGEMKDLCYKYPHKPRKIIDRCYTDGVHSLNIMKCSKTGGYKNIFKYTDAGINELSKLFGLEKYLLDFSLVSEKEVTDAFIWQDYLVYASLFGIADKVAKQLKTVYPQKIPEIEAYERNIIFVNTYRRHIYTSMISSERAAQRARSGGSGGRVSFGGGGGFSGGGSGGGSR